LIHQAPQRQLHLHAHISINNFTRKKKILNDLPFYILESKYPDVKRPIKILFHSRIVTLTSPSKFLTGTRFLHAYLQAVYYNCVKFHLNPMSRLGGVALTNPSLHTERISEYKLNYLPFQILDSNHIPSCTSAGSVLQLCKVS
jgi:hypothetical protein